MSKNSGKLKFPYFFSPLPPYLGGGPFFGDIGLLCITIYLPPYDLPTYHYNLPNKMSPCITIYLITGHHALWFT